MGIVNPAASPEPVVPAAAVQPSSANAATAGQIAQGTQSSPSYTSLTKVSSLASLRKEAPDVYKMMMRGIAMTIIDESRRMQERIKEAARKARQDAGE